MSLSHGRAPKGLSLETQVAVTSGSGGGGGSGDGTVNVNIPDAMNIILPEGGLGNIGLAVATTPFGDDDTLYAGTLRVDGANIEVSGSLTVDASDVSVSLDVSGLPA